MIHILWPDNQFVPYEKILDWYQVAVVRGLVDGRLDILEQNAHDAALLLDEAGLITLARVAQDSRHEKGEIGA